jgi:hypothetical protein
MGKRRIAAKMIDRVIAENGEAANAPYSYGET